MENHTEVSSNHSMPLILLSARDFESASVLKSELVDDNVIENDEKVTNTITWRIINKYYRVDVGIYSLIDTEPPPPALAEQIEAHIIFITDDEDDEAAAELAEERWARAVAAGADRADVCLVVAGGARASPALLAWTRRRRYELVPLRERAGDDSDADDDDDADAPFAETYGAERARAALHAHAWRGLERLDRPARVAPAPREPCEPTSSDDEYEGAGDEDEEEFEAAVEHAEAFAEALGALGAAGAAARGLPRDERLRRAECLVAAMCRALGSDLPAL